MTIAYASMLFAVLVPYAWILLAKARVRINGEARGYNNHAPRAQQDKMDGWRRRAVWAQNNAFEAMPGFLAAMLVAMHAGVAMDKVDMAAEVFVLARLLHGVLYIADKAAARSAVWMVGIGAVVYLFAQALMR
jgi:uncharacterized MAPEG superfamily protein